jgi:hypothetical protein
MAKNLLILLHGIGKHSDGWANDVIDHLSAIAATYPLIEGEGPLESLVEFKPLHYDFVFQSQVDKWRNNANLINEFAQNSQLKVPNLLNTLVNNALPGDEADFLWDSVMDAVMYRGVDLRRDDVRVRVAADIVSAVNAHLVNNSGTDVIILGHSLGTIVTHDVLHELGSMTTSSFSSEFTRFTHVFLLANATLLGPKQFRKPDPEKSVVRPLGAPAVGGQPFCGQFWNINNHWDPIGSWARFGPHPDWGDRNNDIEIEHIHQLNVHGINHYLDHPKVHIPLLRALVGFNSIPKPLEKQRVQEFENEPSVFCIEEVKKLKQRIDVIRDGVNGGDFDEIAKGMLDLYRAVQEAKDACEEMFNDSDGLV